MMSKIDTLREALTKSEILPKKQQYLIKGGDGEDLRRTNTSSTAVI